MTDLERDCTTCLYRDLPGGSDTCRFCIVTLPDLPNWTPAAEEAVDLRGVSRDPVEQAADPRSHIASEALRIVNGDRRGAYGTPEDNFARIARFWTAYMQNTGRNVQITAEDVSPMMRLMKEARLCENPGHLDSHIDLVGYTLTGAEVNGVKIPT
jgi:hypothetical protein